jgi:hypothetical protein
VLTRLPVLPVPPAHPRRTPTRARRAVPAALLAVLAPLGLGCDAVEDKAGEISGQALENGVRAEIERLLAEAGVELRGDLDCTSDKDLDAAALSGVVSVNCTGTAQDNAKAVAAFNGSVSPDGCTGRLNITVGSREIYNDETSNICG